MDKMRMETPDLTAANVEKIGALFPNCVTETTDENGKLKCQTARCRRHERRIKIGSFVFPTARSCRQRRLLSGITAHCHRRPFRRHIPVGSGDF